MVERRLQAGNIITSKMGSLQNKEAITELPASLDERQPSLFIADSAAV
jgi:hypothetical protein